MAKSLLEYEGCNFFSQRIILSLLSGKNLKISNIRSNSQSPGITGYESSLLHLISKFTVGTKCTIEETGTEFSFTPGKLTGGDFTFDCDVGRSLGYYLEVLVHLAPFCEKALKATLRGVTSDKHSASVDRIQHSTLPILKKFLGDDEEDLSVEIKIIKRGSAPEGGGEVVFMCPPVRQKIANVSLLNQGKVWKIRGITWSTKMAGGAHAVDELIRTSREILRPFLSDIRIFKAKQKHFEQGLSPGFGMILWATTKTGVVYSAEVVSNPKGSSELPSVPEDLGKQCAVALLNEINRGGCVDSANQSFTCLMMALREKDVAKVKMGQLTDYTLGFLRNMQDFFGVRFNIEEEDDKEAVSSEGETLKTGDQKLILKCSGVGYCNLNRVVS